MCGWCVMTQHTRAHQRAITLHNNMVVASVPGLPRLSMFYSHAQLARNVNTRGESLEPRLIWLGTIILDLITDRMNQTEEQLGG